MELSDRLKTVAGMVTAGGVVCDVGCDHGYVPIYLIRQQVCPRVIAMDVKEGPLEHAREHVRDFGLEEYIEIRRSDGLEALETGEADCLIMAGMGGRLVVRILTAGREKACAARELIVQPQSEIGGVRRFLREGGYQIVREDMVYEDGKYYPVMKAVYRPEDDAGRMYRMCGPGDVKRKDIYIQACDRYGALLLDNRHPVLYRYLLREQEREEAVLREIAASCAGSAGQEERRRERERELRQAEKVREYALSWFASPDSGLPDRFPHKG